MTILHGDCREQLATLPDNSVDAIVTDPPYELGFMGKKWDASGIAYDPEVWGQCLRVLKPGGHLLAFGGTRTYHRMAVAIEDAGFEIRDSIHWLYGSGFPKSLDVSKAIDKQRDDRADIYRVTAWVRAARDVAGITNRDIDEAFGFAGMAGHWTSGKSQPAVPTLEQVPTLLDVLGVAADEVPDEIRHLLWDLNGRKGQPGENWAKREIIGERDVPVGHSFAGPVYGGDSSSVTVDVTAPATDAAREWQGWGTALKPAHEPIVLARKPLVGTVAANVMAYGTGALNIDATRIGTEGGTTKGNPPKGKSTGIYGDGLNGACDIVPINAGRWPANLILTHSPDCQQTGTGTSRVVDQERGRRPGWSGLVAGPKGDPMPNGPTYDDTPERWDCVPGCPVTILNTQSGERPGGSYPTQRGAGVATGFGPGKPTEGGRRDMGDTGGASRFFKTITWDPDIDVPFLYVAKPSRRERNAGLDGMPERAVLIGAAGHQTNPTTGREVVDVPRANFHPTVKPVALIRYLIRLITPPDGTVLDPFLGSGTTAVAAILEGHDWIGCELTADYLPIIEARVAWAEQNRPEPDLTLFSEQP
jgi:DNA modification methylase